MIRHTTAALFGASTVTTVLLEALGRDSSQRFGLSDMAMPALTAHLAATTDPTPQRDAAIAALLASTAGDMSGTLPFKLGWFATAHLCYIRAFSGGTRKRWWAPSAAVIGAGVWATSQAAGLRPACTLYAVLVAALVATASTHSREAGLSALLFALSDLLIGIGLWRTTRQTAWGRALIIAFYLTAQAGLADSIRRGPTQ